MSNHPDLTTFRVLSFDCYGTLIDWESGLAADLQPLIDALPEGHPFRSDAGLAVQRFNEHSERLWAEQPTLAYHANLAESFRALAREEGVKEVEDKDEGEGDVVVAAAAAAARRIGDGPGRWPAFDDTVDALRRLARRYKLVVLSNVDEANIARAQAGPLAGARFDAVYTAEAIGSYKPSLANFGYLLEHVRSDFGVIDSNTNGGGGGGQLLHVARSLTADHVPAKQAGLRSVWIARGGDKPEGYGTGGDYEKLKAEGKLGFEWMFQTLGEFADEVDRQFSEKENAQ
ncbi:hypothetical protein VTH82DRAFT_2223 [Thermothelomyces myriococcoides]